MGKIKSDFGKVYVFEITFNPLHGYPWLALTLAPLPFPLAVKGEYS